jgi:hypothetical protein
VSNLTVRLRVICLKPPPDTWEGKATRFGLQNKEGELDSGTARDDGARIYECEAQVKLDANPPNFLGKYTHGTPTERFMYLSWGFGQGTWVRRIKIPLKSITREQIEQAAKENRVLQAVVEDGTAAATIKLKEGWTLV